MCNCLASRNCGISSIMPGTMSPSSSRPKTSREPMKSKRANAYAIIEDSSTDSAVETTDTNSELRK